MGLGGACPGRMKSQRILQGNPAPCEHLGLKGWGGLKYASVRGLVWNECMRKEPLRLSLSVWREFPQLLVSL